MGGIVEAINQLIMYTLLIVVGVLFVYFVLCKIFGGTLAFAIMAVIGGALLHANAPGIRPTYNALTNRGIESGPAFNDRDVDRDFDPHRDDPYIDPQFDDLDIDPDFDTNTNQF